MAVNYTDFDKIWASASPLTPYEFSENNYKAGWYFVGATPPSRQMWDFLQKQNDEKLKYLLDNFDDYLPLSGGTMSGTVTHSTGVSIKRSVDNADIQIYGASNYNKGAYLRLYGKDNTLSPGAFQIVTRTADESGTPTLTGKSDGTLTWDGSDVITAGKFVSIAQTFEHTYATTDWEQVGSITIPPKCIFFIRFSNNYISSKPNGAVITNVTGTNAVNNCLSIEENQSTWNCATYYGGNTLARSDNLTLYLYGRYPSAMKNESVVNGWYIETT